MSCDVGEVTKGWRMSSAPLYIALLILKPFCHFTYVTNHSPTLPSLYVRHSSFSNLSVASPMSQLILQPFRCFTYVTAHSPTLQSLYLHHSSVSNPSVGLPISQLILQPFFRFSYITGSSLTSPGKVPMLIMLICGHDKVNELSEVSVAIICVYKFIE